MNWRTGSKPGRSTSWHGVLETLASKLKSLEQIDAVLNAYFHLRITTGPKTGVQRSLRNTRAQQW